MQRWKGRLQGAGLKLAGGDPAATLTNLRFADDLFLFADSLENVQKMLDVLQEELGRAGLSTNRRKTKILTFE